MGILCILPHLRTWKIMLSYPLFVMFFIISRVQDIHNTINHPKDYSHAAIIGTSLNNVNKYCDLISKSNLTDNRFISKPASVLVKDRSITLEICSIQGSHCHYQCTNRTRRQINEKGLNVTDAKKFTSLPFLKEFMSPCFQSVAAKNLTKIR